MTTLQIVKAGATQEVRHFTATAATHTGLGVRCGSWVYRSIDAKSHGVVEAAVAAAIDATMNASSAGGAPADQLQHIEPL